MTSMKSFEPAVRPVTATSAPAQLADGGRDDLGAQDLERALGGGVGAAALDRERDDGDGLVGADRRRRRARRAGRWRAPGRAAAGSRPGPAAAVTSVGLDHGRGRDGAAGEGGLDAVVGLDDRLAARVAVEARLLELDAERGDAEGDEQAAGEQRRDERALEDAGEDGAPDARLALGLVAALGDVGHAALLEPVLLGRGTRASRAGRSSSRASRRRRRASCRCRSRRRSGCRRTAARPSRSSRSGPR